MFTLQEFKARTKVNSKIFDYGGMREYFIETLAQMIKVREADGLDSQRIAMSRSLAVKVQQRLDELQSPAGQKCSNVRVLVCESKKNNLGGPSCGWGCMLHHALDCFTVALATHRVLIINETFYG